MVKFFCILFRGREQNCAKATECGCTCMIKRSMWVGEIKRNEHAFSPFFHVSEMVLTLSRSPVLLFFAFYENTLRLYLSSCSNSWAQTCHLAQDPCSMLPMYAKHPKQSVNNKDFKWQARSRVNDKGQLASMQPLSVKDKRHGVTTHMGTWPIYGSKTYNSSTTRMLLGFLSFCQHGAILWSSYYPATLC